MMAGQARGASPGSDSGVKRKAYSIDGAKLLKSRQTWHRAIDPTGKRSVAYQPLTPDAIPNPESDPATSPAYFWGRDGSTYDGHPCPSLVC